MRVIKYFFEEPTSLELVDGKSEETKSYGESAERPFFSPEGLLTEHRHYRGYLAAADLESGINGGSSLEDDAAARALATVIGSTAWLSSFEPDRNSCSVKLLTGSGAVTHALVTMSIQSVMITGYQPDAKSVLELVKTPDRNSVLPSISGLLDAGSTLVFSEPSHIGHDWSIFSAEPLAEQFRAALGKDIQNCRKFVIPFVKARGEHKFYFEQYDLEMFAEYEVDRAGSRG